jgi:hypothetical protein
MSWIPWGAVLLKIGNAVQSPKEAGKAIGRTAIDVKDAAADLVTNRGALTIYKREAGKKISRAWTDTKDEWRKLR